MNRNDHITYDILAIEREARRLRAEATRSAFQSMVAWMRGKRDTPAIRGTRNA